MAQNVSLLGADYPDVPQVVLPKTGGGNAVFTDTSGTTATASDVLNGKKFYAADGTETTGSIQSQSGTTVTPTRSQQTLNFSGKYMTGNIVIDAIPNTYYTAEEALELFYPVGSIYVSTSSSAPTFGGTWFEILIPLTAGDIDVGSRSYESGTGTGTLHFWRRTA